MRIQVTDKYFIDQTSDVEYTLYQKTIAQEGKKKGEMVIRAIGYFMDISSAIQALIRAKLFDRKETVSLRGFLTEYKRIKDDLTKQLKL